MKRIAPLMLVLALSPALATADGGPYAWTYQPTTEAAGEAELELYETFYAPDHSAQTGRSLWHQLEFAYGLTERFDAAVYAMFRSTSAAPFEVAGFKLRGRYKLLSESDAPIGLVLYLEGEKELVDDKPWGLEEKIIVGRDFGPFSFAANAIAEQEWVGGEMETSYGWSAGAAVRVTDGIKVGAETFGDWKQVDGVWLTEGWVGPSAMVELPFLRKGPIMGAWLTANVGFGLTAQSDDVRARLVLGVDW